MIFVDTSGIYAILDADDSNHAPAKALWSRLLADEEELFTTNYVLVETFALVQRRLGMEAVRVLQKDILPVIKIEWVNPSRHATALGKLIAAANRQISLVDWVSFETMRHLEIETVFAFDNDFASQKFDCVPK